MLFLFILETMTFERGEKMNKDILKLNNKIEITQSDVNIFKALTYAYSSTAVFMAITALLDDNSLFFFTMAGLSGAKALQTRKEMLVFYRKMLAEKENKKNNTKTLSKF